LPRSRIIVGRYDHQVDDGRLISLTHRMTLVTNWFEALVARTGHRFSRTTPHLTRNCSENLPG